ncbi:MAG: hypothetical protein ACRC6A_04555, partial [Fusobacteriaceae bacterium]
TIKKENTKLTIDPDDDLELVMNKILDSKTKTNLLKSKPDMTLEEFRELYDRVQIEFQNGFCNSINSCLILAARGAWNFRSNSSLKVKSRNLEHEKKVLENRVDYYLDYFKIANLKPEEALNKFNSDCQKYDSSLVEFYFDYLKERLI